MNGYDADYIMRIGNCRGNKNYIFDLIVHIVTALCRNVKDNISLTELYERVL